MRFIILFLFISSLYCNEITVDLNDPVHRRGTLTTDKGGVITTKTMRIQADHLEYRDSGGMKTLFAKDNFLLVYRKKFFVGDSFEYNFTTGAGKILNGVTSIDGVFVGGNEILFHPDGTIEICGAFATTCDHNNFEWSVQAKEIHINQDQAFKATNVTFNIYKTPVFWFPFYSMSAKKNEFWDSLAKYRIYWDKGQGLLFMMRYRIWDYEGLKIYWRGEYRIAHGLGTAVELDYTSPSKRHKLETRNFYAYDTFYNDNDPKKYKNRYRLQGIFNGQSADGKLETFARWDILSDKNMRQDFPTQLFELETLERTEAFIKARYDPAFISIYARPRLNTYRGFKEELPTFKVALKPYVLNQSGIVLQNYFRLAYLDYLYADNLKDLIPNFHSSRFETHQLLYRPFVWNSLSVTPSVGFYGILYGNNPKDQSLGQAVFQYNLESHATFFQDFLNVSHYVEPYLEFTGFTKPTANIGNVYIFSIEDGFNQYHQIKTGIRNSFFIREWSLTKPRLSVELFLYDYFKSHPTLPEEVGLNAEVHYPSLMLATRLNYHLIHKIWNYTNFYLSFTLNENVALALGLLNRGIYDFRKNDHTNHILDISHTTEELLHSPVSDPRTTLFLRWEVKLPPSWTLSVQNHLGWRPNQPFYHESNIDLSTIVSNCWKARLSYMRTVRTNQVTFGVTLIQN